MGHVIRNVELHMYEDKVHLIQKWEALTKVTELRSFLILVNYYSWFSSGYSRKAKPLAELLKTNKSGVWA